MSRNSTGTTWSTRYRNCGVTRTVAWWLQHHDACTAALHDPGGRRRDRLDPQGRRRRRVIGDWRHDWRHRRDHPWPRDRHGGRRPAVLSRHSLRSAPGRRPALVAAAARRTLARGAAGDAVRPPLTAERHRHRHGQRSRPRRRKQQRGLSLPERLHACLGRRPASGDGLDSRRRLRDGFRHDADPRPAPSRGQGGRGDRHPQLSNGHVRLPAPRRIDRGCDPRERQRGSARPGRRAHVGTGQHRTLRREPGQRHHVRPVGGGLEHRLHVGHARGRRTLPPGHPAERRLSYRAAGRSRRSHRRPRPGIGGRLTRRSGSAASDRDRPARRDRGADVQPHDGEPRTRCDTLRAERRRQGDPAASHRSGP